MAGSMHRVIFHLEAYRDESRQIMQLVAETGAVIEQMSIDEAWAVIELQPDSGVDA